MARDFDNNKGTSFAYILAAIILAIVMITNLALVQFYYNKNATITASVSRIQSGTNSILSHLNEMNLKTLNLVASVDDGDDILNDISDYNYAAIKSAEGMINQFNELPEKAVDRYKKSVDLVDIYFQKLQEHGNPWIKNPNITAETRNIEYNSELYPYYITASEMLKTTSSVISNHATAQRQLGTKVFRIVEGIMIGVFLLGELAILLAGRVAKRSRLAIAEREKNLAEVDAKLKNTRQKASDLAVTNILTGMKNRYALDGDISERLESDRFNIAVFDLDNFRSINDTYGYDFGDEFLAAVAEQLKEQFSSFAEIYNITGNEFCFLFNRDISENQAMAHAQKIQSVMSSPYNIMNLTVQLTCSGALYHYLPGDCLNVNSLLVKLDTAMRNVKMNGGNMITSVMNI